MSDQQPDQQPEQPPHPVAVTREDLGIIAGPPVDEAPVDEAPVDEAPVDEAPVDDQADEVDEDETGMPAPHPRSAGFGLVAKFRTEAQYLEGDE